MTDVTVNAYRPGPRRPAEAPHLHVVPPPDDSEVPTSGSPEEAPAGKITAGQSGSPTVEAAKIAESGFRVRATNLIQASRTYWTPPQVFTHRPASLADLAEYARQAPWTAQQAGIIRAAGVGYYRMVAYPYTVVSRYREWFAQRPLRLVALLTGLKIAALTGPGHWVVHTVVYPAAHLAGRIFL